ncbi:MAG: tail fiber domain-containing protein [Phycisphaeraceae bacterium]|nr:tail fiber domain-containing protein [Phycisphaerales bacterium]MCB9859249.1 tail fiber domain-containing protein [Phycisphaeraceae bacterium]
MRTQRTYWSWLAVIALVSSAVAQTDTTFMYQGHLKSRGAVVGSTADMRFRLYDAETNGNQIGSTQAITDIVLDDGLFNVQLDFGASAFNGEQRWLGVDVRSPAGTGTFVPLSPRQPITRAPYAMQTRGIFVDTSERVGIGTQFPQLPLEVHGEIAPFSVPRLGVTGTGSSGDRWLYMSVGNDLTWADGSDLRFATSQAVGGLIDTHATMTSAGYLGIGTTLPKQQLHNTGDYYGRGHLWLHAYEGDGQAGTAYIQARDTSNTSDIGLTLRTQLAGTVQDAITVFPNGQIYFSNRIACNDTISSVSYSALAAVLATQHTMGGTAIAGRTSPVTGTAYAVRGDCASSSGYDFYAVGAGINYGSPSSIRWKRNIKAISDPLDQLTRIRGVHFDWDQAHGGNHDIGFIGEEVGQVLPEIVAYEDNGDFVTGMDYSRMTPLLTEAVKQLRAEKDAEIAALHDRIETLEATVKQLVEHIEGAER